MLLKALTLHVSNMYCNEIFWVLALHTASIFSRPEIIIITCIILETLRKLSSIGPHETEPPFILFSIDCAETEQVKLKKALLAGCFSSSSDGQTLATENRYSSMLACHENPRNLA